MNKKGFTLLEVLLVIVILGIILVISVPKIINVIEENKEKVYRNSIKSIEESAREYVTMHPDLISDEDFTIELSTLCDAKYLDCPLIDPRTKEEMTGKVYYVNDKYYYGLEDATTLASAGEIDNVVAIDKITINGKSEQINTTAGTNLAPPFNKWTLLNGARLEGDYIILPESNSKAYVDVLWNSKGAPIYVTATYYSGVEGGQAYAGTEYYDANMTQLSGNGWAQSIPTNVNTTLTATMGGSGVYAEALRVSKYVRVLLLRGSTYGKTEYKFKNVYVGLANESYTEFVPDSPSPEYPSTIDSIGVYNSATNKYDVTLFKGKANLITNGYGELKNNTNFSSWTYVNNEVIDAKSSFRITSSSRNTLLLNEFISVDTSKKYDLSLNIKDNGIGSTYYSGIIEYDIDKQRINASNVMYSDNTLTYLTQDLKNGDTVIHLNSVANFEHVATTPEYRLGLIFWNYKDSMGYQYPELTYSRNVWFNLYYYDAIDVANNTITLRDGTQWNHGTFLAGTKVSQSNSGSSYNYSLNNSNTLATDWRTYNASIQDICTTYYVCTNKFRAGTKYIKFLSLNNYNNTANTVTYYKDISIREYDTPTVTYSLTEPLRSLPDGTTDKLIIDNVNKRAYVERNIGVYSFTGSESWSGPARQESYKMWAMQSQAINGYDNTNEQVLAISNMLKPVNYYTSSSLGLSNVSIHNNGHGSIIFTLSDYDTGLTSSATESQINLAFQKILRDKFNAGTPVTVQYKRATTGIEELPYQEVNCDKTNFNLTMEGAVQPTISIDYIKNG